MSLESAKKFLEKMVSDSAFATAIKQSKSLEERRRLISGAGFDFTEKEISEARQGELKDEELDAVAGGSYMCVVDIHDN